jgi:hypothetical protein
VRTSGGPPITWALADAKLDERHVLMAVLDHDPTLTATRLEQTIIADEGYIFAEPDRYLTERSATLLPPPCRRAGGRPATLARARHLVGLDRAAESIGGAQVGEIDLRRLRGGPLLFDV